MTRRPGRLAAIPVWAALAVLAAGCARVPVYGPPQPGLAASPSPGLQLFKQAETGPFARAFQAAAAAFNRDSRNRHITPVALGEDAYQVSDDILAWSQAMSRAPVPPEYRQAKARLLDGLALLRQGYRHIGDGLLSQQAAEITRGRADVRSGDRILGGVAGDLSL